MERPPLLPEPLRLIADLHLAPRDEAGARRVAALLATITDGTLAVLGDLFDVWLGPRHAREPCYRLVLDALAAAARRGVRLVLVHGNRDFLIDPALARRLGARLVPEAALIALPAARVLITHGDLLCTADRDYQKLRAFLRRRWVARAAGAVPFIAAEALGRRLRGSSRRAVAEKPARELALTVRGLRRAFATGADAVVAGHVHRQGHYRARLFGRPVELLVLPAWEQRPGCLEYRAGRWRFTEAP